MKAGVAPVISAVARAGRAMEGVGLPPADADLASLLDAVVHTIPAPDGAGSGRSLPLKFPL